MKKLAITVAILGLVLLSSMFVSAIPPIPPNPPDRPMQLKEERTNGDGPRSVDYSAAYDTASGELIQNMMDTLIVFDGEHMDNFRMSIAESFVGYPLPFGPGGPGIDSGDPISGLNFENPANQTSATTGGMGINATYYWRYDFKIRQDVYFQPPYNYRLTPEDVAFSFQRTMIMDFSGGPAWMLQEPLLDNAAGDSVIADLSNMTQVAELGALIRDSVQYNSTDVWFNLMYPSVYAPFWQILCQTWSSIESKQWIINQVIGERLRYDWNGDWTDTTSWLAFHDPLFPPLDEGIYVNSALYGSGPFIITTVDYNNRYWVGERYVGYWRGWPADFPSMANAKPAGYVNEIYVTWANVWATRLDDLTSGAADFVAVPRQYIGEVFQHPDPPWAPPNYPIDGVRDIQPLPQLAVDAFFFNFRINFLTPFGPVGPPGVFSESEVPIDFFGNAAWGIVVRKAFAQAFSYDAFIAQVYRGEAIRPATAIIPGLPYYDPTVVGWSQNLDAANASFNAVPGLSTTGFTMTLVYTDGWRNNACFLLKEAVEYLNPRYHINLEYTSQQLYLIDVQAGYLPMFLMGWQADFPDQHDFAVPFYRTGGTYSSWQSYSNATMDALINQGIATPNGPARAAIYKQIQQLAVADVPSFTLAQALGRHFERDWVVGWYYNPLYSGIYFYNLWKWYYAPQVKFLAQPMSFNLPADVNYDGKVNIKDVITASRSFGASAGPPLDARWNFRVDFNNDRKIDIKDISYVAKYFGPDEFAVWIPTV